jgi:hypothetical protein
MHQTDALRENRLKLWVLLEFLPQSVSRIYWGGRGGDVPLTLSEINS